MKQWSERACAAVGRWRAGETRFAADAKRLWSHAELEGVEYDGSVRCPFDHAADLLSHDECRTWPVSKVVYDGPSAYVDLAACHDYQTPCLYEAENYAKIILARFGLEWRTDAKDSLRPKKP